MIGKSQIVIAFILISTQVAALLYSPANRTAVWINGCVVDDWRDEYHENSQKKAYNWCGDSRDRMSALMLHMKKHAPSQTRVVTAAGFGSNVRAYYMPRRDEFLINAEIVGSDDSESHWYECRGERSVYKSTISVAYVNANFVKTKQTFHNVDAFALLCEISRDV